MFYDNLKAECDRQGLKVSPLVKECGGAPGSISGWKKGAYPNSDFVIKAAKRLNVSTDYLLGLNDVSKSTDYNLSENELKLLHIYKELPPIFQSNLLERAEAFKFAHEVALNEEEAV